MRTVLATVIYGLRNRLIDVRFGSPVLGYKQVTKPGELNWIVNTDYSILPHIFRNRVSPSDVIVDVGCGRGRVINWLLLTGHTNKIIGIELDEPTAAALKERLRKWSQVEILCGDARENIPADATVFYLFNPFPTDVMVAFAERLKALFLGKKSIRILYYRPVEIEVFRNDPVWRIEEFEIPLKSLDARFAVAPSDSYRKYAVIEFR